MIKKRYRDKVIITKSDPLFVNRLKEVSRDRWSYKKDKTARPLGIRILERKILRHKDWPNIERDLRIADFIREDDGFMVAFNWFTIIIVAFLAVVLFAGLIYVSGLLNNVFTQVGVQNDATSNPSTPGYVNMTQVASETFGQINNSVQALRLVALTLIFSLIIGTILINFLIKVHPAYFFLYILIVMLAIIFSAPVSNAYYTLITSGIFGGLLPTFTGVNWIMLNLPLVVAVGGVLGGVFLFINILRTPNEGSLV